MFFNSTKSHINLIYICSLDNISSSMLALLHFIFEVIENFNIANYIKNSNIYLYSI